MIFRALLYGYLGAILGGIVIGVSGAVLHLTPEEVVAAAVPAGVAAGLMGLSVPPLRAALARRRIR